MFIGEQEEADRVAQTVFQNIFENFRISVHQIGILRFPQHHFHMIRNDQVVVDQHDPLPARKRGVAFRAQTWYELTGMLITSTCNFG